MSKARPHHRTTDAEPVPSPPPVEPIHGPARPHSVLFGLPHLRKVMALSTGVDVDRMCEDAALEIEHLRSHRPRSSAFGSDRDFD